MTPISGRGPMCEFRDDVWGGGDTAAVSCLLAIGARSLVRSELQVDTEPVCEPVAGVVRIHTHGAVHIAGRQTALDPALNGSVRNAQECCYVALGPQRSRVALPQLLARKRSVFTRPDLIPSEAELPSNPMRRDPSIAGPSSNRGGSQLEMPGDLLSRQVRLFLREYVLHQILPSNTMQCSCGCFRRR